MEQTGYHNRMNKNDLTEKAQDWQEQAEDTVDELQDRAQEWQDRAKETARRAAENANVYVRDNPWTIIGSVALVALALGILLGRSRD